MEAEAEAGELRRRAASMVLCRVVYRCSAAKPAAGARQLAGSLELVGGRASTSAAARREWGEAQQGAQSGSGQSSAVVSKWSYLPVGGTTPAGRVDTPASPVSPLARREPGVDVAFPLPLCVPLDRHKFHPLPQKTRRVSAHSREYTPLGATRVPSRGVARPALSERPPVSAAIVAARAALCAAAAAAAAAVSSDDHHSTPESATQTTIKPRDHSDACLCSTGSLDGGP